ncbi:CDP-alcohol phosphatidyltransferase family protein [Cellvibrio mixtus]|uniref:CDP-alcohol phosphatidyltransferase family protein n=1 Tax=Cellvibrio mixtus TaxID=39650 RepID=UPI000693926A|nr:CDP-alcohol phosphatidyltransferase family protein [Cellvibrio mixtus]
MHNTTIYKELRIIGVVGLLIIVLSSTIFWIFPNANIQPAMYFPIATSIWFFCWWQTWKRATLNRPEKNSPAFPNLGWANNLTLLRGGLIALTGGFLFQPDPIGIIAWLPGLLYSAAAILDRVDGFIARRTGRTSLLGSELDTLFDALGLLIAPLLAIQLGKLHWSFFAVSLAYYVFIFGIYWRHKHNLPTYPLLPSQLRRAFAGFQMGFVAVILLPVFPADATVLLGAAFMLPILIGFVVDWLVVSGRIDGTQTKTLEFFFELDAMSKYLFQPALRIIISTLIFFLIYVDDLLSSISAVAIAIFAILILLGAGARIAALLLLMLCSYLMNEWHQPALLFTCSWLLLLGPGNYALWRGDDVWVNRQDGA